MTERLHFHFSLSCIGEGNGNPIQRSCLENPRDGGAWWAAVYGVPQSWTRLKRLSSSSSIIGIILKLLTCGRIRHLSNFFFSPLNSIIQQLLMEHLPCLKCCDRQSRSKKPKGVGPGHESHRIET